MSNPASEFPPDHQHEGGTDETQVVLGLVRSDKDRTDDLPPEELTISPIDWTRFEAGLTKDETRRHKAGDICRTSLEIMLEEYGVPTASLPSADQLSANYYTLAEYLNNNRSQASSFGYAHVSASNDVDICLEILDDWLREIRNPLLLITEKAKARLGLKSAQADTGTIMAKLFAIDHSDVKFEEPTLLLRLRREAGQTAIRHSGGYGSSNFH